MGCDTTRCANASEQLDNPNDDEGAFTKMVFIPGESCLVIKSSTVAGVPAMLYSTFYDGIVTALV